MIPVLDSNANLPAAFANLVASSYTTLHDHPMPSTTKVRLVATIPALQSSISLEETRKNDQNACHEMVLHFECTQPSDFGWICQQLYASNRKAVQGILDLQPLRTIIAEHLNTLPPDAGQTPPPILPDSILGKGLQESLGQEATLRTLRDQGYVILDNVMPQDSLPLSASNCVNEQLQDTGQGGHIRSDRVYFMNRAEAAESGWVDPFDLLMACATILNEQFDCPPSPYQPLPPATRERPLTVPREIQYAEYRHGDFYKAHSDNSWSDAMADDGAARIRSNFRAYTCILYMNDRDWNLETDGGALRLYPNTQHLRNVDEALGMDHVDVAPIQGRLLVFDSCLVHSVQKVKHPNKVRRALTLWINRPNDSGVKGEEYF